MDIISYRFDDKFHPTSAISADIRNYASHAEAGFNDALKTFHGLVLYHGGWNAALDFLITWESKLRERRFAVLFFSTEAYVTTTDECRAIPNDEARKDCEEVTGRTDLLPYFHLLTYRVDSPSTDPAVKQRFTALIGAFKKLRSLDQRYQVQQLWEVIDPVSVKIAEKQLLIKMRDLEGVIAAGRFGEDSPSQHIKVIMEYYGDAATPYDRLREDYLDLCRRFLLKKKLSRWQTERESLNHKDFQHYFYDLIARPPAVAALDDFSSGRCTDLPPSVTSVLKKWASLKAAFSALFLRANPEAVASCELNLALVTPEHPKAAEIIQRYKDNFGDEIDAEVETAQVLLDNIDAIINRLLKQGDGEHAACQGGLPEALGTELSARCKEFSTHVSSLRRLADIAE